MPTREGTRPSLQNEDDFLIARWSADYGEVFHRLNAAAAVSNLPVMHDDNASPLIAAPELVLNGTVAKDTLDGGAAADTISGGDSGDRLNGGGGNDILYGFGAADATGADGAISAVRVASGLSDPVFAVSPPGDDDRLFIVEQHTGQIKILDLGAGIVAATPFLDIPDNQLAGGNEQGLLGLAFHPDYASNGLYYVNLTNASGATEIWQYTRGGNPDVSSTTRELVLSYSGTSATNHNGGWMDFGPDGMLYIAAGDGGPGDDPENNAQDINSLFGKILRLDVDGDDFPADATRNYAIPDGNPYVGVDGADEVFAIGLRNPWRNSFDPETGDLYIADVGQSAREEINFVPAGTLGGRNFGWVVREGAIVHDTTRPGNPPAGSSTFTNPIYDYTRGSGPLQGFAVTGGYVVRGPDAGAQGLYVFADYVSDNLWTMYASAGAAQDVTRRNGQLNVNAGDIDQIASFALDGQNRLYVIGLDGEIHRLTFSINAGDANDTINGGEGNDQVFGGIGDDILMGSTGNDKLNGGVGADSMRGQRGNDTYYIDAADRIAEARDEGNDTVRAAITHTLGANIENLIIGGAAARNGSGNSLDNLIAGNAGANALSGRNGADTLNGGGGNDTLNGGDGLDLLTGGDGADAFVFSAGRSSANTDTITDFNVLADTIHLDNAIFTALGGAGALGAGMFRIGAAAQDANDYLIYNANTGALYYDSNGDGAGGAVRVATLAAGLALTSADFLVI